MVFEVDIVTTQAAWFGAYPRWNEHDGVIGLSTDHRIAKAFHARPPRYLARMPRLGDVKRRSKHPARQCLSKRGRFRAAMDVLQSGAAIGTRVMTLVDPAADDPAATTDGKLS